MHLIVLVMDRAIVLLDSCAGEYDRIDAHPSLIVEYLVAIGKSTSWTPRLILDCTKIEATA